MLVTCGFYFSRHAYFADTTTKIEQMKNYKPLEDGSALVYYCAVV
ncbi:hypothetical protein HanIR_Chr16g0806511 [Helianthus annuus]|nr:hypothetical protein HanIR_Chr16g0806511 [Helianthus annuus]